MGRRGRKLGDGLVKVGSCHMFFLSTKCPEVGWARETEASVSRWEKRETFEVRSAAS